MLRTKHQQATRKVRLQVERGGKKRWVIGTVVGKKSLIKTTFSLFGPNETYAEDRLLVQLSNRSLVKIWDSEVFEVVS